MTLIGKSFVVSICLRHLADTSPTVGRLLVCALAETYRPLVGQPSADSRPTDGRQTANRRPQAADRFFRKLLCTVPLKLNLCHPEILCTYMIQYYRVSSILHFFTYQQNSILSCFFNMTPNNLKLLSVTKGTGQNYYTRRRPTFGVGEGVLEDSTYLRTLATTFYWLLNLS